MPNASIHYHHRPCTQNGRTYYRDSSPPGRPVGTPTRATGVFHHFLGGPLNRWLTYEPRLGGQTDNESLPDPSAPVEWICRSRSPSIPSSSSGRSISPRPNPDSTVVQGSSSTASSPGSIGSYPSRSRPSMSNHRASPRYPDDESSDGYSSRGRSRDSIPTTRHRPHRRQPSLASSDISDNTMIDSDFAASEVIRGEPRRIGPHHGEPRHARPRRDSFEQYDSPQHDSPRIRSQRHHRSHRAESPRPHYGSRHHRPR